MQYAEVFWNGIQYTTNLKLTKLCQYRPKECPYTCTCSQTINYYTGVWFSGITGVVPHFERVFYWKQVRWYTEQNLKFSDRRAVLPTCKFKSNTTEYYLQHDTKLILLKFKTCFAANCKCFRFTGRGYRDFNGRTTTLN